MIKQLIDYILNIASKHKAVNYTAYLPYKNINDQHNNKYYQFIIEDEAMLNKQLIEGIDTINLDIDILGFINKDNDNLTVQDNCLHILLDVLEFIKNDNTQLEVRDYSIVSFSNFTDDRCSGIRCSLQLIIPSPINICQYEDNFINKPIPTPEPELDMSETDSCTKEHFTESNDNRIDLNPIDLNL